MKNLYTILTLVGYTKKTFISLLFIFFSTFSFSQTSWIGATDNDWANDANWTNNTPAAGVDAIVGDVNFTGSFQPTISSLSVCNSLTVGNGMLITINTASLKIRGDISGFGQIDAAAANINFNGTAPQAIPANLFLNNQIGNLTISNATTTTLEGTLDLIGTLNIKNGQLITGGFLTLKSSQARTAKIAEIQSPNPIPISGDVTVERYIPSHRAWRMLAVPASTTQTIHESWQENGYDTIIGYGTQITGGDTANGFDQNKTGLPSIKIYDQANNSFSSIPLASTYLPIADQSAYFVFIRGDRTVNLNEGTGASPMPTTLRTKGGITTGTQIYPVYAPSSFTNNGGASKRPEAITSFTLIGNPYASPIDFLSLIKTNVPSHFSIWDPYLGSVGGYQLFDEDNSYIPSPGGGSYGINPNTVIQSGQAFFVESDPLTDGSIIINEIDKSAADNNNGLRPAQAFAYEKIALNLSQVNTDNSTMLKDGSVALFNKKFSVDVNKEDAGKMNNLDENISFVRNNKMLSIEKRPEINLNDTLFIKMWNLKKSVYQFDIKAENFQPNSLTAYIEDAYMHTIAPLNLSTSTKFQFTVTSDAASYDDSRFKITFKSAAKPILQPEIIATNITVYPNPVKGKILNIYLNNEPQGPYYITLTDRMGRVIYKNVVENNGGSIKRDLKLNGNPAKGMYNLKISSAGKTFTQQVMVD